MKNCSYFAENAFVSHAKAFLACSFLIAAILFSSTIAGASISGASGDVTCGTATVDGNFGEWDLDEDFFAEMHEAGKPTKAHMSNVYLRYDVVAETIYALVLREGSWKPEQSASDAWIKIYDLGESPQVDGNSSDFQWVYEGGTLIGYEASFHLVNGYYPKFEAHITVKNGRTSSSGKKKQGYTPLTVDCSAPVSAACGLGAANEFNTFIFEDFTATSDTEGRLAVGGNASLAGYSVADKLTAEEQARYQNMLIVGGELTYTSGRVYYGDILVGGSATLPNYSIADGETHTEATLPIDFAAEAAHLEALSTELSSLSTTGSATNYYGGWTLYGDGDSELQVFSVNGEDLLEGSWGISAKNLPADATVVINISGKTAGFKNMNFENGTISLKSIQERVLFNFYEAETLMMSGVAVRGSVLAPFAAVENPVGVIWGTIVAKSWTGGMQQNHVPFEGELPCIEPPVIPQPDPASLGDFVWEDTNGNGEQDLGEAGVEGVIVKLYSCDETYVQETTTNAAGKYLFEDLEPASYYVTFSNLPDGYTFTTQGLTGTSDPTDSDASASGKTECTTLESGENDMSWDAGIVIGAGITKYQQLDDSEGWTIDPLFGLQAGETVSYQISVENYHYADDTGFLITDSLSELVVFDSFVGVEKIGLNGDIMSVSADDYTFLYDEDAHAVSLDYTALLLEGESLNFLFDVTAGDGFGGDMTIDNQASVEFGDSGKIDSNVVSVQAVPEPGTVFLLGLGLLGVFGLKRRFTK